MHDAMKGESGNAGRCSSVYISPLVLKNTL